MENEDRTAAWTRFERAHRRGMTRKSTAMYTRWKAEAILLIDDNVENVLAARRAGCRAVSYESIRELGRSLRELGL